MNKSLLARVLEQALPIAYVTDNGVQIANITCDHEKENNRRVINELKVLSQHLLDYNRRAFEKFMRHVGEECREQISAIRNCPTRLRI